jgi:Dehydrogenases with different specificities (related to short-chain alcohol dehydrogenases)
MNRKKVALITGASRGIGKAIAIHLAKDGYHLILNSIHSKDLLNRLKIDLEMEYNISCLTFLGDIGDFKTAKNLFENAYATFGHINVVVNNAGISHIGLLSDMNIDQWNMIIQTNLTSVFNCSKLAIPSMVSRKSGKIINISSVWGSVGASCEVAYSATKGAIHAFTKALAKELAPSNIQVNCIACGMIDTDINSCFSEVEMEDIITEIPAGRLGTPTEIGEMVLTLCQTGQYLTGQIIHMDGGWI